MKTLAWIYLIAYPLTALGDLAFSMFPEVRTPVVIADTLVIFLSLAVMIIACSGKLKPRKPFLIMSGFHMLLVIFGIVLGFMLVAKIGPDAAASGDMDYELIARHFPWVTPAEWVTTVIAVLLGIYGIAAYCKAPAQQTAA